jgi:hypothetical protein
MHAFSEKDDYLNANAILNCYSCHSFTLDSALDTSIINPQEYTFVSTIFVNWKKN